MGINFNGVDIDKIIYNGVTLDKLIYNGVLVWENSVFKLPTTDVTSTTGGLIASVRNNDRLRYIDAEVYFNNEESSSSVTDHLSNIGPLTQEYVRRDFSYNEIYYLITVRLDGETCLEDSGYKWPYERSSFNRGSIKVSSEGNFSYYRGVNEK